MEAQHSPLKEKGSSQDTTSDEYSSDSDEYESILLSDMSVWKFLAIGTTLGFLVDEVCLYPIDLIKTRLQVQSSVYSTPYPRYKHTWDAFRSIIHQEGFRALYQGFWVSSAAFIPSF